MSKQAKGAAAGAANEGDERVTDALCAALGVTANELLGSRAYDDHYVVVVADGRKLQVPLGFVDGCAARALEADPAPVERLQ